MTDNRYKNSIENFLLIWGTIFAPMTALRIFKFGPGEVFLILWMLLKLYKQYKVSYHVSLSFSSIICKYQIANLIMMVVGAITNALFYKSLEGFSFNITDYSSHFFMFLLASCIITFVSQKSLQEINWIIYRIVIYGAIVYGSLLLYGLFFSSSFFGVRLWMGNKTRFLGLAINPHQIGMITGTGVFFSLYLISLKETKLRRKVFLAIASAIWFIVSLNVRSDTMTLCYIIMIPIFISLQIVKSGKDPSIIKRNIAFMILLCLVLGIIFYSKLMNMLNGFILEAGNGAGRIAIWESGLGQFADHPLLILTGFGPGANTGLFFSRTGHGVEAHNTYVQQVLNAGIFIFFYYIIMITRILKGISKKNTFLILAVIYFVLYGFGGNMNRRAVVWITYAFVYIIFGKKNNKEETT